MCVGGSDARSLFHNCPRLETARLVLSLPSANATSDPAVHPNSSPGAGASLYAHATKVVSVRGAAGSGAKDLTESGFTSVVADTGQATRMVRGGGRGAADETALGTCTCN